MIIKNEQELFAMKNVISRLLSKDGEILPEEEKLLIFQVQT